MNLQLGARYWSVSVQHAKSNSKESCDPQVYSWDQRRPDPGLQCTARLLEKRKSGANHRISTVLLLLFTGLVQNFYC